MDSSYDAKVFAFDKLKYNLNVAARAFSARLSDLIDIPANPNEIISMFPNALFLESINQNPKYCQTCSTD